MIGHLGLYLASKWADLPEVVITMIALARHFSDASTAAIAVVCAASIGGTALDERSLNNCVCQIAASASLQIFAIERTHSNGYSPFAVSPKKKFVVN